MKHLNNPTEEQRAHRARCKFVVVTAQENDDGLEEEEAQSVTASGPGHAAGVDGGNQPEGGLGSREARAEEGEEEGRAEEGEEEGRAEEGEEEGRAEEGEEESRAEEGEEEGHEEAAQTSVTDGAPGVRVLKKKRKPRKRKA